MTALIALLIRHALMLCAGFFAAHGIDGSSSVGLITGLLMLGVVTAWSLAEKWLSLKPGQLTGNAMLRSIAGALASQLVTAASSYFAVDANQPVLLGVALVNAGLAKAGLHQKLASLGANDALKLLVLLPAFLLSSCSFFQRHQSVIEGILMEEARRVVPSAKQPQNVQPSRSADDADSEGLRETDCEEPRGEALPACLKLTPRITVPRYGVQVASHLSASH